MQLNESIRIAYLVSQYPAINHMYILREVRRLRALGFGLKVISIESPDRPPEKLTPDELEESNSTCYVKALGLSGAIAPHLRTFFSRPLKYLRGLSYALKLGRFDPPKTIAYFLYFVEAVIVGDWMRRNQFAHVHIHFSSTVGLILGRIFPVTVSITIHGSAEFIDPTSFHLAEKVRDASFICTISNYGRSQLMRVSDHKEWNKLEVAPLGIDPNIFKPHPFRENPAPFEVLYVGQLSTAKGLHILLAALERLVEEGRKVRLRLVGDGPERKSLEDWVSARGLDNYVVFEGFLNQDQLQTLYLETDVFALSSFAEGVPVVLMEAMAMEIPCVATRITGIPELIRDRVDGLLVTPSDEEELSGAIGSLMDDTALRRQLGEAGRQRVIEKYDLERNISHLAAIFHRRMETSAKAAQQALRQEKIESPSSLPARHETLKAKAD
jgi:glycosyltransferase involved in cell wall biosynthesis